MYTKEQISDKELRIVCHIETKEEWEILNKIRGEGVINNWLPKFKYYLCCNTGFSEDRSAYATGGYKIIELNEIEGAIIPSYEIY